MIVYVISVINIAALLFKLNLKMDNDERFKHIITDPKFRRIPKSERKIKIDKRFKSMFKDEKFKLKYTVDKRGRPVNHTTTEDLKRYYELSTDSEESSENSDKEEKSEAGSFVKVTKPPNQETANKLDIKEADDELIPDKVKKKLKNLKVNYARGEGNLISDSSSSDDDSDDDLHDAQVSDDSVDHAWGELDKDADKTDDVSNRLAVCNQDWDRIRAVDLMVLFTSFVPAGGVINFVSIYPSDFGIQRMQQEDSIGPTELLAMKKEEHSDAEETEEGSKYRMEKLRQYQLNRLKYYYAVVDCDSPETANRIYTECDGLEYESSATKIDLRFIPDGTEFENTPKEVCEKIPERYQPRFFTTTALQQAKVELTWDETNPERLEVAKKLTSGKIDDVTDQDLQAYLASSSGEETDDERTAFSQADDSKNPIDKYRALLQDIEQAENDKQKDVQMEITWGLNLKENAKKLVKKKLEDKEEKTPFQQFLSKRKEKRKAKREEKKKQTENDNSEDSDVPSDIDMNDSYFAEEFNNPEFKKKPKDKKQKGTEELLNDTTEHERAELELLLLNEHEDSSKKHFSLQKIQEQEKGGKKNRKKKKKQLLEEQNKQDGDNFEVNVKDDRFSALYSSHHYNIDPTDPNYRKTRGMEAIVVEKLKRRNDDDNVFSNVKKPKLEKNAELNVLVKNIKRKTEAMKMGKKY